MKTLELNQMEVIVGGDMETCYATADTLLVMGVFSAFTPAGAALLFGGGILGLACHYVYE